MSLENVVLVFKKSLHQIYFKERNYQLSGDNKFRNEDIQRLQASNRAHETALDNVRDTLTVRGIRFREVYRARRVNYNDNDFVISVGGDGTFLEAARRITTQTILGVNSNPKKSIGNFCPANAQNIGHYLDRIIDGNYLTRKLNRMKLLVDQKASDFLVTNDILLAHQYPGAMSRYAIKIGQIAEEQRGSGIWVSTAAGSSGAILAAGGKRMPLGSRRIQYLPRELFHGKSVEYKLTGGFATPGKAIELISHMREGMTYVDGAHLRIPVGYGTTLNIANSEFPLSMVTPI